MEAIWKKRLEKIEKSILNELPLKMENKYYEKMSYSGINLVENVNVKLLRETISFEVAFLHLCLILFSHKNDMSYKSYRTLVVKIDVENLFSWYMIDQDEFISIKNLVSNDNKDILYDVLSQHDKFLPKSIKSLFGQFYTPANVTKIMSEQIKEKVKILNQGQKIVDPACGTGVFVIELLKEINGTMSCTEKLLFLNNEVYAFDINPFAIIATKLNILNYLFIEYYSEKEMLMTLFDECNILFPNIMWRNTITDNDCTEYDVIICNPPYFKLRKNLVENISLYENVIFGQPNIYTLFLYWALKRLKKDGVMCFIIPQSLKSGVYFKKLRSELYNYQIPSIIHIDSRLNIFDRVEQAVLIMCLKKSYVRNAKTRIVYYDNSMIKSVDYKIQRTKLMLGEEGNYSFVLFRDKIMYNIFSEMIEKSEMLNSNYDSKFGTGLFVWNQHKNDLIDDPKNIPIIYGGNVQENSFQFSQCSKNEERKMFARCSDQSMKFIMSGKKLLVQRTTNGQSEIRIKSCIITSEFLDKYEFYLLENHVNYLDHNGLLTDDDLYYYLGVFNSKIFNLIYSSRSGSTQVSANELNLLPYPSNNKNEIIKTMKELILTNNDDTRKKLEEVVCMGYGLNGEYVKYILEY